MFYIRLCIQLKKKVFKLPYILLGSDFPLLHQKFCLFTNFIEEVRLKTNTIVGTFASFPISNQGWSRMVLLACYTFYLTKSHPEKNSVVFINYTMKPCFQLNWHGLWALCWKIAVLSWIASNGEKQNKTASEYEIITWYMVWMLLRKVSAILLLYVEETTSFVRYILSFSDWYWEIEGENYSVDIKLQLDGNKVFSYVYCTVVLRHIMIICTF